MKRLIITLVAAFTMLALPLSAQEKEGFKKFDVVKEFSDNGFKWFSDARLLCAGDYTKSNAMTIGWGAIGTAWGRPALTVYVAQQRYTKEFIDKTEYFTVMTFENGDVLTYMGTNSGRDGDKAQALGLTTAYTANGTPYYTEAKVVIECKLMYGAPFDSKGFKDVPKQMYKHMPSTIHWMYIGEVLNAWKK